MLLEAGVVVERARQRDDVSGDGKQARVAGRERVDEGGGGVGVRTAEGLHAERDRLVLGYHSAKHRHGADGVVVVDVGDGDGQRGGRRVHPARLGRLHHQRIGRDRLAVQQGGGQHPPARRVHSELAGRVARQDDVRPLAVRVAVPVHVRGRHVEDRCAHRHVLGERRRKRAAEDGRAFVDGQHRDADDDDGRPARTVGHRHRHDVVRRQLVVQRVCRDTT